MTVSVNPVTIKKYGNRRLYTLETLAADLTDDQLDEVIRRMARDSEERAALRRAPRAGRTR